MNKLTIVAVALHALVFVVLLPILEINDTHLTNPEWPSHARLHEAWQLLTNAAIGLFALYLVATKKATLIGIRLCLIIAASFIVAYATSGTYGGSMLHSDGTELAIAGVNVAVLIVAVVGTLLVVSELRERKAP